MSSADHVAGAEPQQPAKAFDFTVCYSGNVARIDFDPDHVAWGIVDEMGFTRTEPPGGLFDRLWMRCVGSGGAIEGRRFHDASCELADSAGDKIFMSASHSTVTATKVRQSSVRLLAGTGKYEGIRGEGTSSDQVFYREAHPTLYAGCTRYAGTYGMQK